MANPGAKITALEVGRFYRSRDGLTYGPLIEHEEEPGAFGLGHSPEWEWALDGECNRYPGSNNGSLELTRYTAFDLLEAIPVKGKPLELEVGKTYVAANGQVFGPLINYNDKPTQFTLVKTDGVQPLWNSTGRCFFTPNRYGEVTLSDYSLVAEHVELPIAVPSGANLGPLKNVIGDNPTPDNMYSIFNWACSPQGVTYWGELVEQLQKKKITRLPFKARHYIKKCIASLEASATPKPDLGVLAKGTDADYAFLTRYDEKGRDTIENARLTPPGNHPWKDGEHAWSKGPQMIERILAGDYTVNLGSAFDWDKTPMKFQYWCLISYELKKGRLPWCAKYILEIWLNQWKNEQPAKADADDIPF